MTKSPDSFVATLGLLRAYACFSDAKFFVVSHRSRKWTLCFTKTIHECSTGTLSSVPFKRLVMTNLFTINLFILCFKYWFIKLKVNFENVVNFVELCIPRYDKWLGGFPILTNRLGANASMHQTNSGVTQNLLSLLLPYFVAQYVLIIVV